MGYRMPSERGYDARLIGLFFKQKVWIDGIGSNGDGGFSHTFFERSQECTGCGACCRSNYQQTWYWYDFEARPDVSLQPELMELGYWKYPSDYPLNSTGVCQICRKKLLVNATGTGFMPCGECDKTGVIIDIPIWVHYNKAGLEKCDFLGTAENPDHCSIHKAGTKPLHCLMAPQVGAYHIGDKYYLSKRLPSRNWRHPKCPIIMIDTPPPNDQEKAMDREILERLQKAFGHIPGCMLNDILPRYERLYDLREFYRLSVGSSLLTFQQLIERVTV